MACFIESENDSTKGILNPLDFSHVIFIHTIKRGLAVVKTVWFDYVSFCFMKTPVAIKLNPQRIMCISLSLFSMH